MLKLLIALGLALAVAAEPTHSAPPESRSRQSFAASLAKIAPGTPASEVLAALGAPDDKRTESDPGGVWSGVKEVWRYGTSGHLTPATLGEVVINESDLVEHIVGGSGTPPPEAQFTEAELRRLLDCLGRVRHQYQMHGGWEFDPRALIRAVNALQPLGKDKALAVIAEHLRVTKHGSEDDGTGDFLVLRALFDVPTDPGHMPWMCIGTPEPSAPKDRHALPRFPIVVEGDIPFLVVEGYSLAGLPEQPEAHLEYFRKHGVIRSSPLQPSDQPVAAVNAVDKACAAAGMRTDERSRKLLLQQLLPITKSAYACRLDARNAAVAYLSNSEAAALSDEIAALKVKWDSGAQKYVKADGSSLVEPAPKFYVRETWKPKINGFVVSVIVERESSTRVMVAVDEAHDGKATDSAVDVRVFDPAEPGRTIAQRTGKVAKLGTTSTNSHSWRISLAEGRQIQVQCTQDGQSQISPVFVAK